MPSAKNDRIDAVVAARGSLHKDLDQLADTRAGQTSTTLQVLLTARTSMTSEPARAINALKRDPDHPRPGHRRPPRNQPAHHPPHRSLAAP